jgi:hypothetical protein
LLLAGLSLPPSPAAAQGPCEFRLGFKAIADRVPGVVGTCLEDEHFNPANGDSLQQTNRGLLVWRKEDNFTAFTDGYRSWVNGPFGLQQRLNAERFPWEGGQPAPASPSAPAAAAGAQGCVVSEAAVTFEREEVGPDGGRVYRGTAGNPCHQPIHMTIDLVERGAGPEAAPLADAPTAFVRDLAPGASSSVTIRAPAAIGRASYSWRVAHVAGDERNDPCVDVGADRCLRVDPWLVSAVQALSSLEEGRWLLRGAARGGVRVRRERTPANVLGYYQPSTRTLVVDARLDQSSSWVRATVLAHELRHAIDDVQGTLGASQSSCYEDEEGAFRTQSRVWGAFWGGQLPPQTDRLHSELNAITLAAANDPAGLAASLASAYHEQCGRYAH